MKLELNLPALERLIGGDTEIEVSLRKQIVQEFTKRHLKKIAETTSYEKAIDEIKNLVNQSVKNTFGIENLLTNHIWPTVDYRLKSLIENIIKEHAQKAVDEALLKIIQYQKHYWSKEIENAVKKIFNRKIEEEITKGIQERLSKAANPI